MKKIKLSDHFTMGKILLFSLPAIGNMLVFNVYGIVNGFFISNYIGKSEFAADNLIVPVIMLFLCLGTMFGVGGTALVS